MGSFSWCFRREGEGRFRAISKRVFDPFLRGEVALKPDDDGKVRLAFISGPCEDRQPLAVTMVELSTIEVNKKGYCDRESRMRSMTDAMNLVDALAIDEASRSGDEAALRLYPEAERLRDLRQGGVVVASAAFEKRRLDARHRWKLTGPDVKALHEAINKKARSRIA